MRPRDSSMESHSLEDADRHYKRLTWEGVKAIVDANRLELLTRVPSHLQRYRAFRAKLDDKYPSVVDFMLQRRLHWADLVPSGKQAFTHPDDAQVLYNDWPYGLVDGIVHLVVWSKLHLEEEPANGDMTAAARNSVNDYVTRVFRDRVGPERVLWFRNWNSIRSVDAIEHIHILLLEPDPKFVAEVTKGDAVFTVENI